MLSSLNINELYSAFTCYTASTHLKTSCTNDNIVVSLLVLCSSKMGRQCWQVSSVFRFSSRSVGMLLAPVCPGSLLIRRRCYRAQPLQLQQGGDPEWQFVAGWVLRSLVTLPFGRSSVICSGFITVIGSVMENLLLYNLSWIWFQLKPSL